MRTPHTNALFGVDGVPLSAQASVPCTPALRGGMNGREAAAPGGLRVTEGRPEPAGPWGDSHPLAGSEVRFAQLRLCSVRGQGCLLSPVGLGRAVPPGFGLPPCQGTRRLSWRCHLFCSQFGVAVASRAPKAARFYFIRLEPSHMKGYIVFL